MRLTSSTTQYDFYQQGKENTITARSHTRESSGERMSDEAWAQLGRTNCRDETEIVCLAFPTHPLARCPVRIGAEVKGVR